MPETRTFYISTLGCKINQYESQVLREAWQGQGLQEVQDPALAGDILVNSCAVTDRALQDLRKEVRRLHRLSPGAAIVLTGCAASGFFPELQDLPGVSRIVPQKKKQLLDQRAAGHMPGGNNSPGFLGGITDFPRARPVLKVQDGCSSSCTYCIVPKARGGSRSRSWQDILQEALILAGAGFQELVISGINLAQFRLPGAGGFWELVRVLDQELGSRLDTPPRLRLSSLDPGLLGQRALDVLGSCRLICPHLHLSLQSASPKVLQNMGRIGYQARQVQEFLSSLRSVWPMYALGADLLLGFPGETEQDFLQTYEFCRTQSLSYAHVFTYSPRPGTKAAHFPDQVDQGQKKRRSQQLRTLMQAQRREFLGRLCSQPRLEVVLEQTSPALGLCEYYVTCLLQQEPDNLQARDRVFVQPVEVREGGVWSVFLAPNRSRSRNRYA
ncbi:MAG: MiaB/RimO family radical SAM methylthiotransferase [Desulfohalobiaceae bacterium]